MNIIELLAVGIRLIGFYALIQIAQYLMGTAQVAFALDGEFRDDYQRRLAVFIVVTAFWCLIAFFSLKLPMTIARKLLGRKDSPSLNLDIDARDLLTVGIALMGLLFFYYSFSDLLYNGLLLASNDEVVPAGTGTYADVWRQEIVSVVEVILSGALIVKARVLSGLVLPQERLPKQI
ncbi:hypothetical protein [Pseudomonas solani]|uniref:hypothetical protein n=1 Tax=Pseudomonas solani TaxID=2731552 RepID=UPI003C2D6B7A